MVGALVVKREFPVLTFGFDGFGSFFARTSCCMFLQFSWQCKPNCIDTTEHPGVLLFCHTVKAPGLHWPPEMKCGFSRLSPPLTLHFSVHCSCDLMLNSAMIIMFLLCENAKSSYTLRGHLEQRHTELIITSEVKTLFCLKSKNELFVALILRQNKKLAKTLLRKGDFSVWQKYT